MGLGSIYAGIGLAQGLGSIPESYTMGRKAAEESAMNAIRRQAEMEALKNTRVSREKTIRQMEDEQKLRDTLSRLSGLGSELQSAFTPETKEVATTVNAPIVPEATEGEGIPFVQPEGMAYKSLPTTKKVQSIDYDKIADIKNKMAMGYQEASLLDPRYAVLGQKAIDSIDERILKRTFGAGLTGDTKTIASGLKVLTGQEFDVKKDGDMFLIQGAGDSVPFRLRMDELLTLSDPNQYIKYAQQYQQQKLKNDEAARRAEITGANRMFAAFPYIITTPDYRHIPVPTEEDAIDYTQSHGGGYSRNIYYDEKLAQIEGAKARTSESQSRTSTRGQKYLTVTGKPLSENEIRDINKLRSENPDLSEDDIATLLAGQGIQIVGYKGRSQNTVTKTIEEIDPKTGAKTRTTTRTRR